MRINVASNEHNMISVPCVTPIDRAFAPVAGGQHPLMKI